MGNGKIIGSEETPPVKSGDVDKIAACYIIGLPRWEGKPLAPMTSEREGDPIILEQSLKSVRDEVDEIVIIFTGVVDFVKHGENMHRWAQDIAMPFGLQALLKKYDCAVVNSPWQWNFSLHRNEGFDFARHLGCKWGLIVDADERLECPRNHLRELAQGAYFHVIWQGNLKNRMPQGYWSDGWQPRFLSLSGGSFFESSIHNKLRTPGVDFAPRDPKLIIRHGGYALTQDDHSYKLNHRVMIIDLALTRVEEAWGEITDGSDPEAKNKKAELLYYKASILFRGGRLEAAAKLLFEYEELSGITPDLLALRADILRRMGNVVEAMNDLNRCLNLSPNHFDAHYYLGTLHLTKTPPDVKLARHEFAQHAKMVEDFKKAPEEWKCNEEMFTQDKVAEGKRFVKLVERALKKDDAKEVQKVVQDMNNVQYEDGAMKGAEDVKPE